MKFGPQSLDKAVGKILAHNLADEEGRRLLRKGIRLDEEDIEAIRQLGRSRVYVAELEGDDVAEDEAARRVAESIAGDGVRLVGAATGRTNLMSTVHGLLQIDRDRLAQINAEHGITLSTLRGGQVIPERQMVATVKVIPYAIPAEAVERIEARTVEGESVVTVRQLEPKKVAIILHGANRVRQRLIDDFVPPLQERIQTWGSELGWVEYVEFDMDEPERTLAEALVSILREEPDLVILAGETAIMDGNDIIPAAITSAGGHVESFGAPVDPGNLLMLAYCRRVPILGAPGCARSRKENIVDWVIPRLLSGEELRRQDIISLGHGGLLAEIRERPMPRQAGRGERA